MTIVNLTNGDLTALKNMSCSAPLNLLPHYNFTLNYDQTTLDLDTNNALTVKPYTLTGTNITITNPQTLEYNVNLKLSSPFSYDNIDGLKVNL